MTRLSVPQGKTDSFCLERKTQEESSRENRPDIKMERERVRQRTGEAGQGEGERSVPASNKDNETCLQGSWEPQVDSSMKGGEMST